MMSRSLHRRYSEMHSQSFDDLQQGFFKAVCLLDTNLWPTDRDHLAAFGVADVSLAVEHFRRLLLKNNVSLDGVMTDWTFFKMYWIDNIIATPSKKYPVVTASVPVQRYFQTLCKLVCIPLVFPVSNAIVERSFSAMRRIKSDWRSSLSKDT